MAYNWNVFVTGFFYSDQFVIPLCATNDSVMFESGSVSHETISTAFFRTCVSFWNRHFQIPFVCCVDRKFVLMFQMFRYVLLDMWNSLCLYSDK